MDWLSAAEDDFRTAELLLSGGVFYASAFYCQQAAEKTLKALYIFRFKKPSPMHNLIVMSEKLLAPPAVLSAAKRLNPHYVQSRYPDAANALPSQAYDKKIAQLLAIDAKEVIEWAKRQISEP